MASANLKPPFNLSPPTWQLQSVLYGLFCLSLLLRSGGTPNSRPDSLFGNPNYAPPHPQALTNQEWVFFMDTCQMKDHRAKGSCREVDVLADFAHWSKVNSVTSTTLPLKRENFSNWKILKSLLAQNLTGHYWDKILLSKMKNYLAVNLLPFLRSPVCNLENSRGHPTYRKKDLCDLLNLTPLPFSVMLLGYHGNQVAVEISFLSGEWGYMTNIFLHVTFACAWRVT